MISSHCTSTFTLYVYRYTYEETYRGMYTTVLSFPLLHRPMDNATCTYTNRAIYSRTRKALWLEDLCFHIHLPTQWLSHCSFTCLPTHLLPTIDSTAISINSATVMYTQLNMYMYMHVHGSVQLWQHALFILNQGWHVGYIMYTHARKAYDYSSINDHVSYMYIYERRGHLYQLMEDIRTPVI